MFDAQTKLNIVRSASGKERTTLHSAQTLTLIRLWLIDRLYHGIYKRLCTILYSYCFRGRFLRLICRQWEKGALYSHCGVGAAYSVLHATTTHDRGDATWSAFCIIIKRYQVNVLVVVVVFAWNHREVEGVKRASKIMTSILVLNVENINSDNNA